MFPLKAIRGVYRALPAAKVSQDFFSTNVEITINVPGQEQATFASRAEITQAALGAREKIKSLSVKFPDADVTLLPDKLSAVADVTVDAAVSGSAMPSCRN